MLREVILPPGGPPFDDGAVRGGWWRAESDGRILCELCPRACHLKEGDKGFCFVRENRHGEMALTTYGRSTGFCIDPIEKKPLNHFYPGTSVLSFGTAGCNLGCKFCQNWDISKSREVERSSARAGPAAIAAAARQWGCRSVAFTYNDPVIWAEYAIDVARACREADIRTVAVTAGYIMPRARETFFSWMDGANVDLKAFSEDFYWHYTSSHLQPVLDTLEWLARETDVWFEITNLIIPNANDSEDELRRMCDWIVDRVGDERPVHFSAFHPDYRLRDTPPTPHATLARAYEIARHAGLKYVYLGNVDDGQRQGTRCPQCDRALIARRAYEIGAYHVRNGQCEFCAAPIAGRFDSKAGNWGCRRQPVSIADFEASQSEKVGHSMDNSRFPVLNSTQEAEVHRGACRVVAAEIAGRVAQWPDATLAACAEFPVEGAFVTLKRRGDLRACCGTLGRTMPLERAVRQAAARTAGHDVRLPPIGLAELPYLDLDVTLLHHFRLLPSEAAARRASVEIGRHGLQIQRGNHSGLLLPIVAVEHGLDVDGFLAQVCRKAQLPSDAWKSADAELMTFEGVVIDGPFDIDAIRNAGPGTTVGFTPIEVAQLSDFAQLNVLAHLTGATPTYYLPSVSDRSVAGLALIISGAPGQSNTLSRLSLRPGLPLQSTLFQLTASAADMLRGSRRIDPRDVRVAVGVLEDCAMHGTVAQSDLRGFEPQERALLVMEQNQSTWLHDRAKSEGEIVDELTERAGIRDPDVARLFSLRISTNAPRILVSSVPPAQAGQSTRPAAVAGTFYPESADRLAAMLDSLISPVAEPPRAWPAAMVPHAGLRYSGRIAAQVWQQIELPPNIIILGPKHTRYGVNWAVAPHDVWALPGRDVPSNKELAQMLASHIRGLELDAAAHASEHAIEVELPWVARFAPHSKVVGIAIGACTYTQAESFAKSLADAIRDLSPRPLLVISSDLNHFATDEENRRLDELALSAMAKLEPRILYDTVLSHDISMCGVMPAVIVMLTLKHLGGLDTFHRVAYGTSADTSGDTSRVVGYGGALLA